MNTLSQPSFRLFGSRHAALRTKDSPVAQTGYYTRVIHETQMIGGRPSQIVDTTVYLDGEMMYKGRHARLPLQHTETLYAADGSATILAYQNEIGWFIEKQNRDGEILSRDVRPANDSRPGFAMPDERSCIHNKDPKIYDDAIAAWERMAQEFERNRKAIMLGAKLSKTEHFDRIIPPDGQPARPDKRVSNLRLWLRGKQIGL